MAPSVTNPSVETPGHRIIGQGSAGLTDALDVSLTVPQLRLGLKYQFIGEPRLRADKGNFSLALSVGVATAKEKESSTGIFSTTTQSFELRETVYDGQVILGYRVSKDLLLYGGPFLVFDRVRLGYVSTGGTSSSDSAGTIRSVGGNLGLQMSLDEKFFVRAEGAGSKTRLGRANVGRGDYGFSVGMFL